MNKIIICTILALTAISYASCSNTQKTVQSATTACTDNSPQCQHRLLEQKADAGDRDAMKKLGDIYLGKDPLSKELRISPNILKAYEWYIKSGKVENRDLCRLAVRIANAYLAGLDPATGRKAEVPMRGAAFNWLVHAFEFENNPTGARCYPEDIWETPKLIGILLESGEYAGQNTQEAVWYYRKFLRGQVPDPGKRAAVAFYLSQLYAEGNGNLEANPEESLKWAYIANEYYNHSTKRYGSKAHRTMRAIIQQQPIIDSMQNEIEEQIIREENLSGIAVDDLELVKSQLQPSIREAEKEILFSPESAASELESVRQKAIQAITALVIAQTGEADTTLIRSTFYYLAVYLCGDMFYMNRIEANSPIFKKIRDYRLVQGLTFFELIWFLSRVPASAQNLFKLSHPNADWSDFIQQADDAIAQSEALKTGFSLKLDAASPTFSGIVYDEIKFDTDE